jgi:hypothetical protein
VADGEASGVRVRVGVGLALEVVVGIGEAVWVSVERSRLDVDNGGFSIKTGVAAVVINAPG